MDLEPRSSLKLDTSLLPQYQEFRSDDPGLSLWNYLAMVGRYEIAAALSKLFWPDFVEVDGCILLAEQFELQNFKDWQKELLGDRQKIESLINHVHIWDLFLNDPRQDYQLALHEHLAKMLTICWKHALKEAFPDKEFEFYYETEPHEYGPTISFHQKS
jgi:hypothetical protein